MSCGVYKGRIVVRTVGSSEQLSCGVYKGRIVIRTVAWSLYNTKAAVANYGEQQEQNQIYSAELSHDNTCPLLTAMLEALKE